MSWWLLAASALATIVFSSGMVAAALMAPLEYSHPAMLNPRAYPAARHIVVLTAYAADDALMPLSDRMNSSSAFRVLMAFELYRERPDCDVIVSGSATAARIMGDVLVELGVPNNVLRLEDNSVSTAESAAHLKAMLGRDEFFLVTSGGHMPRSLDVIQRQGLFAIPAPTDHQLPRDWTRARWQPAPGSLAVSDLAIHEHLGRLWYKLRGLPNP